VFTYSLKDQPGSRSFINTKLTRSDITTFDENSEYVILRLKYSKTDLDHKGVEIILAATHDQICPVAALRNPFLLDRQPPTAPLFRLDSRAFEYNLFVDTLCNRPEDIGDQRLVCYLGHSFHRGAAQHAADNRILDGDINATSIQVFPTASV